MQAAPFPKLPLLEEISSHVRPAMRSGLNGVAIVCVQHLLETTGSLFESLLQMGVRPEHMFVLGKSYSTIPEVEKALRSYGIHVLQNPPAAKAGYRQQMESACERLWATVEDSLPACIKTIVVLDEGGFCLKAIPYGLLSRVNVVGIEQTRSGLPFKKGVQFPVVLVASCAAKRYFEPPIISREIELVLGKQLAQGSGKTYGVLGLGSIGQAVVAMLLKLGRRVCVYDRHPNKMELLQISRNSVTSCSSCEDFVRRSGVVLGCTGRDALANVDFGLLGKGTEKHMISCSSGDVEFLSLLKRFRQQAKTHNTDPFSDSAVTIAGNRFIIQNGGCPINFNRVREASPPGEIQLTRALLFGGILQAIIGAGHKKSPHGSQKLSPSFQQFVIAKWLTLNPEREANYARPVICGASTPNWIAAHSDGKCSDLIKLAGFRFELPSAAT
ncbi:MAG: NAD(P)-binding domain-containing protein [Verrucomicrobia bacterium]|nr:NAD(P)-binding domain-containing protein [Verrucomicrobiota bacterium]